VQKGAIPACSAVFQRFTSAPSEVIQKNAGSPWDWRFSYSWIILKRFSRQFSRRGRLHQRLELTSAANWTNGGNVAGTTYTPSSPQAPIQHEQFRRNIAIQAGTALDAFFTGLHPNTSISGEVSARPYRPERFKFHGP